MATIKVKAFKRNGKIVKAHTRFTGADKQTTYLVKTKAGGYAHKMKRDDSKEAVAQRVANKQLRKRKHPSKA